MHILQEKKKTKKYVFTSEDAFKWMVILIWTRYTAVSFGLQVIGGLPSIGMISKQIFPGIMLCLTVVASPWIAKRVRMRDVLWYLTAVLILLCSLILYPDNAAYIEKYLSQIVFWVFPMFFVGVCLEPEQYKTLLFYASVLGAAVMLAYQIYQLLLGRTLRIDDMDASYKALPNVMYLIYYAFTGKKIRYWVLAAVGIASIFIYGTRGPVLCMMVFLFVGFLLMVNVNKKVYIKFILILLFFVGMIIVLSGDILLNVAGQLSVTFSKWGFSTRIFDYFIEGGILEGSGRNSLYTRTLAAIGENFTLGYGVMGDRMILGTYPHNIFIELWCQFGVFFGTGILFLFVKLPVTALFRIRKHTEIFLFIIMLLSTSFVKLMMTGSYLFEANFFLMLGFCSGYIRRWAPKVPKEL